jgi:hypothetical protein
MNQFQERYGRAKSLGVVRTFQIHVVNSDFDSHNEIEAQSLEEAQRRALRGALQIGTDELCKGTPFFGAEVTVEAGGEMKERFLVSMGQSPLK